MTALDAGQQLAWRKGLDHIVIGSGFQARHLVVLADSSREHDDRDVRRKRILAETASQLQPADTGHHPVHENEIGGAFR